MCTCAGVVWDRWGSSGAEAGEGSRPHEFFLIIISLRRFCRMPVSRTCYSDNFIIICAVTRLFTVFRICLMICAETAPAHIGEMRLSTARRLPARYKPPNNFSAVRRGTKGQ